MAKMRQSLLIVATILILPMLSEVSADAMVSGSVFCDQCKDGERSFFDYPLYGARVAVACVGANGAMATYREESTNWMGGYAMRFEGNPDLSRCYARVIGGPSGCGASAGPAQGLNLMFTMFGMQMYAVDPLLSQPQQPMSFCPASSPPLPRFFPPPPQLQPPPSPVVPVLPPLSPPSGSRDSHPPPFPFMQASACSYEYVSVLMSLFLDKTHSST